MRAQGKRGAPRAAVGRSSNQFFSSPRELPPFGRFGWGEGANSALGYRPTSRWGVIAGVAVDWRILIVLRTIDGKWLNAGHETAARGQT